MRRVADQATIAAGTVRAGSPAVSVIVPAYNVARYIGDTLRSVFEQTFTDYEVIVVNDGSPDTPEMERVIEPWRDRIVYVVQENRGLSGARNTGIRRARGEFVALLDSDDMFEPDYLAVQVEMLRRDPSIDVLYCDAHIFGDGVPEGVLFTHNSPSEGEVTIERLVRQECNVMVAATARRETLLRVGLFDEGLRSSEDFDMWMRVLAAGGRVAYHRQPLVRYRRRPGSLSGDRVWMYNHILRVLEKSERTLDLTASQAAAVREARGRFAADLAITEGKRLFFAGDPAAAVVKLREANDTLRSAKLDLAIRGMSVAPSLVRRVYEARDRFVFRRDTRD